MEMTGVDPEVTRVCAALSAQLYSATNESDFNLSENLEVEVKIYDVHPLRGDDAAILRRRDGGDVDLWMARIAKRNKVEMEVLWKFVG